MFQFRRFPAAHYGFMYSRCRFSAAGFPIQRSADHRIFAPTRGLSQLVTSFIGSQCQGIHPTLFLFNLVVAGCAPVRSGQARTSPPLRRSSSPQKCSHFCGKGRFRNFVRYPCDFTYPLAYGHAVGHVLFIRMSSCLARLSACACFFVDTSLITCIHLGCLDILIRLECFVLYVVFKVRSTMFTDDRVQACLITRFRREHCILCRRSSEECEAFRTVGTKPVCQSQANRMEMERFELLTPCLQGRCSPN